MSHKLRHQDELMIKEGKKMSVWVTDCLLVNCSTG